MKKLLPFLTLTFLLVLIALATYNIKRKETSLEENISNFSEDGIHFVKTKIALPEFSLPDLFDEKKNFTRKDIEGKYSVINVFASWCTTCRAEHEILLRLQSEKIIDVYGVAWRDINENTKNYLSKSGNPFLQVASDGKGIFSKIIDLEAVPETWIIDPKGNIVMRYRGNLQEFSIDEIKNFLHQ
jgi:cytochrome c biogenesis protein CcmG/thiol:disulfide interchange protein DsbE